jgi:hypothetical protein
VYQSISGEKSVGDKVKNLHEKDALKEQKPERAIGFALCTDSSLGKTQRS